MEKYAKFESNVIWSVKRGLMEQREAIDKCVGYLHAMVDFGILPECKLYYEVGMTARKILEIE